MSLGRIYSSRRTSIVAAIVELLKTIDGAGSFRSSLSSNVYGKLKYISDISDFPTVCVIASSESREYTTGHYRNRFLQVKILIFVNEEEPLTKIDSVIEDIETLLEDNGQLTYYDKDGNAQKTHDITISSISTDEGALEPIAIGEIFVMVHY
jgi:hypothetical protein